MSILSRSGVGAFVIFLSLFSYLSLNFYLIFLFSLSTFFSETLSFNSNFSFLLNEYKSLKDDLSSSLRCRLDYIVFVSLILKVISASTEQYINL